MPIAFCASAQALVACLAQHAPAVDPPIIHCESLLPPDDHAALHGVQERGVIQLEASPLLPQSYQVSLARVVSMLAIENKLLVVGPSLVGRGVLPFGAAQDEFPAEGAWLVCTMAAAPSWDVVLHSGATRIVLLGGDAFAWYESAGATLTACGQGSLVTMAPIHAAGSSPAACIVNVLVSGMSLPWSG